MDKDPRRVYAVINVPFQLPGGVPPCYRGRGRGPGSGEGGGKLRSRQTGGLMHSNSLTLTIKPSGAFPHIVGLPCCVSMTACPSQ